MRSLKLLALGDIHYPEFRSSSLVDYKDKSVPSPLVAAVSPDKLQTVARQVCRVIADDTISAVLICGDLTSWGDIDGYERCLEYLDGLLSLRDPGVRSDNEIHAVPGNHDVDRSLCSGPGRDLYAKFGPIERLWANIKRPVLTVRDARNTLISANGCAARIFSLNSCIGCGEKRSLPDKVAAQLADLLAKYVASTDMKDAFGLVGEQLDTPAFVEEHITSVIEAVRILDQTTMAIILAHHNILPQATPRIDLYTEAINAGLVRSRMISVKHPILFCHGHIHTDPIEIIASPDENLRPVVSISTPPLGQGFNVLEIAYGHHSVPLGCRIVPYRLMDDGSVVTVESASDVVRFRRPEEYASFGHERIADVLSFLPPNTFFRFPELLREARAGMSPQPQERSVADALREADWFGLIRILNPQDLPKHWQIKKLVP